VMAACRRWLVANRDAVLETTMRETGKNYEDAFANEMIATADTMRFWERNAHKCLADEKVRGAARSSSAGASSSATGRAA